eukprot:6178262-Pleurochrysis_carterae.AAC.2
MALETAELLGVELSSFTVERPQHARAGGTYMHACAHAKEHRETQRLLRRFDSGFRFAADQPAAPRSKVRTPSEQGCEIYVLFIS